MSGEYRYNLRLTQDEAAYIRDAAWKERTTIQGYLEMLVQKDMEIHKGAR